MQPDCFTFTAVLKAYVVAGDTEGRMTDGSTVFRTPEVQLAAQARSGTSASWQRRCGFYLRGVEQDQSASIHPFPSRLTAQGSTRPCCFWLIASFMLAAALGSPSSKSHHLVFLLQRGKALIGQLRLFVRHATRCHVWPIRFHRMRSHELQPSVLEYTQLLQALTAEPTHPDLEGLFRGMIEAGIQPTRVTIKVVEKGLGRRAVKRLLEELNVDEASLGDLAKADFQKSRASSAQRLQECERQKRTSYLDLNACEDAEKRLDVFTVQYLLCPVFAHGANGLSAGSERSLNLKN